MPDRFSPAKLVPDVFKSTLHAPSLRIRLCEKKVLPYETNLKYLLHYLKLREVNLSAANLVTTLKEKLSLEHMEIL